MSRSCKRTGDSSRASFGSHILRVGAHLFDRCGAAISPPEFGTTAAPGNALGTARRPEKEEVAAVPTTAPSCPAPVHLASISLQHEEVVERNALNMRRPKVDYESRALGLDARASARCASKPASARRGTSALGIPSTTETLKHPDSSIILADVRRRLIRNVE